MSLYTQGLSGINAANTKLNTTANNINNADTDGYSRQTVVVSTAGSSNNGYGYVGQGVQVDTVSRTTNSYTQSQLVSATSSQAEASAYNTEINQINNMLGTSDEGISPALQDYYDSVQAVANQPSDTAARSEMLGQANTLTTQINETQRTLDEQYESVNTQIETQVDQANSYLERIAELNEEIESAYASDSSQAPNHLLDERDQMVLELNEIIGVKTTTNGTSIDITTGSGQTLLSGDTVYPLEAVQSSEDPTRTTVAYTMPVTTTDAETGSKTTSTVAVEFDESQLSGGSLSGLLEFRSESLDETQNSLGQLAAGLALSYNEVNQQGLTLTGEAGGDIFGIGEPTVYSNAKNKGSGEVSATFSDASGLTGSDYEIRYDDATGYTITNLTDGSASTFAAEGGTVELDGLSINLPDATTGDVESGDRWSLQPTRNVASTLEVTMTDPNDIAAADSSGGTTNNANALAMGELQTTKIMGDGTLTLTDLYTQIVNDVGVKTQSSNSELEVADSRLEQRQTEQQSISGVNLDEENIELLQYEEQYQAAAQLITVANELFDTILAI
jgi:flagellar hook-associated protein 1 FlgK